MYVAVKGGEKAILNAHQLLGEKRRGDLSVPELSVHQIENQLFLAVGRVMTEGSLYDPELASLAIKQSSGDLIEAIFLIRAYRTTLPRLGVSLPVDTSKMILWRRISATFKDLPGGQILGPTYDYTHRLLDFSLIPGNGKGAPRRREDTSSVPSTEEVARVMTLLNQEGLIETEAPEAEDRPVADLTRQPVQIPADRDIRLQNLARGDEGFLLGLAYSTQRGFGTNHPFAGEIRLGSVPLEVVPEELGFAVEIGEIEMTECQMVNQFKGSSAQPPQFTRGYGLTFGHCERKAMAMALVDRSLRCRELEETVDAPAQDEEFVLSHSDNVEASGFLEHLKLPHYVDFQAELGLVRTLRDRFAKRKNGERKNEKGIESAIADR
jgi:alpha-D-ribose 1-methylphosphonate 5-triphosphate synthase subunit PhnI